MFQWRTCLRNGPAIREVCQSSRKEMRLLSSPELICSTTSFVPTGTSKMTSPSFALSPGTTSLMELVGVRGTSAAISRYEQLQKFAE